ncbi:ThuA domain-containing protein [uncultured Draconibacterium sp.]|uniref:ThuA domain-containing protein n=1 Tax=uncultured Draconibacterium sp. TaxID=1573823 RepID=UPI002AA6BF7D|nr:ThuA domain-containing protein [uncultured Draconibacterium sp.]
MLNKSRRNFISTASLAGMGLLLSSPLSYAAKNAQNYDSLKGKKILFVYGGWKGHEPDESVDVFVPWLKSVGAEVVVSNDLDSYVDNKLMDSVDLIIQSWTMGTITNEQQKGLLTAIKNGAGIAGWHGGIGDSFRNNPEYQFMVGGQWVAHPGGVIDYSVQITDKDDPVTKGLNDFSMHSEQYYLHVDPNVKVLATTQFSGEHSSWIDDCVMPVVWKKYYGKGRVFYSALGHVMSDFEGYEVFEIMKRGIRWAAESKYAPKEKWVSPVYK